MLKLSNIAYRYRGKQNVLRDVSFSLRSSTITVILGPNGAGKTTLLDICLGWRRPSSGEVRIDGSDILKLSARIRGQAVGLVPQRENIRFDFTVLDYVLLGRAPHLPALGTPGRKDIKIAREALNTVGLYASSGESITTLSGGEYQLMLIARSLAQEPDLLLLDEPTSQLDPANRARVTAVLKKLTGMSITVLFTSHSPETAASVADTVLLLKHGEIMAAGAPEEILTQERLEELYGVPIEVRWDRGVPHFRWDPSDN